VWGNHQRLSDHHRSAALGSVGVIMNLPILDAFLSAEVWRNRGVDYAVLECLARQSVRRKKIWIGFVTIHWVDFLQLGELRQAFRIQFIKINYRCMSSTELFSIDQTASQKTGCCAIIFRLFCWTALLKLIQTSKSTSFIFPPN